MRKKPIPNLAILNKSPTGIDGLDEITSGAIPKHDPIEASLTSADDRVLINHWLPPQTGIVPRIRLGSRWVNVLWALPIIFVLLVIGVAVAQALRTLPSVQAFRVRYPGAPASAYMVNSGFPLWLRINHFLNLFFMTFIIRAGVQILADHPRLYWRRDCTPGTDWFRFQKPVPTGRVWTAKDDSVTIPGWLGIPGIRHSIGLARWWHFSVNTLWMLNGIAIYILLFSTDQWQRVIPTDWAVIPNAASTALQYLSLTFPIDHSWTIIIASNSSLILPRSSLPRPHPSSPALCRARRSRTMLPGLAAC